MRSIAAYAKWRGEKDGDGTRKTVVSCLWVRNIASCRRFRYPRSQPLRLKIKVEIINARSDIEHELIALRSICTGSGTVGRLFFLYKQLLKFRSREFVRSKGCLPKDSAMILKSQAFNTYAVYV